MTKKQKQSGFTQKGNSTEYCSGANENTAAVRIATFTLKRIGIGKDAAFMKADVKDKIEYWQVEYACINRQGVRTLNVPISVFSKLQSFQEFFLAYDGTFTGTGRHLADWVAHLSNDEGKHIEYHLIKNVYGRWLVGNKDIYVFRDGFYMDGELKKLQNFFIYTEDKIEKGIMMELDSDKEMAPEFDMEYRGTPDIEDMDSIFESLNRFFSGTPLVIKLIIAFYASSLRYSDFFEICRIRKHPILQVSGKTSTGKTEFFTSLLNKLVGLQNVDAGSWQASSPFVNEKSLSLVSHFPLIRDEYRETSKENPRKMELLRAAFNRVPVTKGTQNLTLAVLPVRSTLILIGENAPSDAAVRNRCISITMGTQDRVDQEAWMELKNESKDWFKFFLYVVNKKLDNKLVERDFKYFMKHIKTKDRTGENYAQMLTVYTSMFLDYESVARDQLLEQLSVDAMNYINISSVDESEKDNLAQFLSHFEVAIANSNNQKFLKEYIKFTNDESIADKNTVSFYVAGMEGVLNQSQKDKCLVASSIRDLLKKELYGKCASQTRIGKLNRSCVTVLKKDCPQFILDFEQKLEQEQEEIDIKESKNIRY